MVAQYQKYFGTMQAKGTNDLKLAFDSAKIGQMEEAESYLCAWTLKPLESPSGCIRCPYDGTTYERSFEGKICSTCELCRVGAETIGLKLLSS